MGRTVFVVISMLGEIPVIRPAIITRTFLPSVGAQPIDATVFTHPNDGLPAAMPMQGLLQDDKATAAGTWHWPPRT